MGLDCPLGDSRGPDCEATLYEKNQENHLSTRPSLAWLITSAFPVIVLGLSVTSLQSSLLTLALWSSVQGCVALQGISGNVLRTVLVAAMGGGVEPASNGWRPGMLPSILQDPCPNKELASAKCQQVRNPAHSMYHFPT